MGEVDIDAGECCCDDATALLLPLAISLMRSSGFLGPTPPLLATTSIACETCGMPAICNLVKASGVRPPAAKRGCKNGQAPIEAAEAILSASLKRGIFGKPPGLSSFLEPDKSKGDSASLGDEAGEFLEAAMKATQVLDHAGCASLQFAYQCIRSL